MTNRREILLGAATWIAAPVGQAAELALPAPSSLADELAKALAQAQPLVVMVSLRGCPYCKIVREQYLVHERAAGLPVVQVDFRDTRIVRDFDGTALTHEALIQSWHVEAAPTILFFGHSGREVAERLRGSSIPDFYGAYLEQRLQQARAAVRT